MKRWGEASYEPAELSAQTVLTNLESAVIVVDRLGNVLYANAYAERMFGMVGVPYVGKSVLSLGIEDDDREQAAELARRVLRGHPWEGTFATVRADGTKTYVRAQAVPLRHPSGAISGIVFIARPALKRGSQREHDRFGLLERIGDRLAGSLELEATLAQVTHTLVPQFADHCMIDLFENDTLVRRVSTHAGGWQPREGTWAALGEQIVYPEGHFAEKAMRRQETVVVEDFEFKDVPMPRPASGEIGKEVGISSVIAAPLCARGELLGVMCLALSELTPHEDPHYDTFDRDFVGAVASRVAIAIDNAMLFEAERKTALAFQTALLPREIPELDGMRIAWRYFAAKPLMTHGQGIQTQVGGDWYDVIPLSAGRVGIVIGDVEGRGARAAAMMGQLRAALRAFAQDDKSPADILRKLDEWVRVLAPPELERGNSDGNGRPPIVTCTYMVYDAWSRELSFANAGHDAPLLVIDGEVGRLEMSEPGVPLGVRDKGIGGDIMFTEETRELPPGATLIMYTDGLVERRPRDDADGEYWDEDVAVHMLRERVAEAADLDVEAVATAAADAVPGDIDDDVAILVLRAEDQDLAVDERLFPAQPIMVSEARRMAAETFQRWGIDDDQADLACLLVSEVVTNVVLHASITQTPRREMVLEGAGPAMYEEDPWSLPELTALDDPEGEEEKRFRLRLRRGKSAMWVEVFDSDLRLPRLRSAGENDEGGRGLYLVDQLTTRWGSRPTKDGKAVWFEIPID